MESLEKSNVILIENFHSFFCRLDWYQKLHHNILIQNLKCCAPHQSEFFKMSFFPWSKKDKKSKEKKGGSVAASSSVVASSPASASSNEISKFLLNFKTSCLSNLNAKRKFWRMFEKFRSHTNFFIREVGDWTSLIGEIWLLQNSSADGLA